MYIDSLRIGFVYRPPYADWLRVRVNRLAGQTSRYSVRVRYLVEPLTQGVRKRVLLCSGAEARGRRGVDLRGGLVCMCVLLMGLYVLIQVRLIVCNGSLLIFIKKFEKNSKVDEKVIYMQFSGAKTVHVPDGRKFL